jgi:hypothetical protein
MLRSSPNTHQQRGIPARTAAILCGLFLSTWSLASPAESPSFEKDVRPILANHCFKCHSENKPKAGINLAAAVAAKTPATQRKLWKQVAHQIDSLEMPPADQAPIPGEQRELVLRWLKDVTRVVDTSDPGRAPLRRLSRAEYNRTLRHLLGVDADVADLVGIPDEAVGSGFANLAETLDLPPALMDKYFAAADKALDSIFNPPKYDANAVKKARAVYDKLIEVKPGKDLPERDAARKFVERFVRRAYRRPVRGEEVDRLMKLYDRAVSRGGQFDDGVRLVLKGVLVSPHFLFRIEQDRAPQGSAKAYRVDDHELAVRLSYFLWSSMPDDELFKLADDGRLSDPAVLEKQVRRMLGDPKARAFTEEFGARWLQINKLADARPSTEFFPTFTPKMRQALYDETATFFDKLREEDRSLLELLDADYTYANEDLAKHYGLPELKGPELRRVALRPQDHRGGLLGMGSVLALTSHTSRTSPTLRGKYVLEVIFGTPPPPPPPDAGMLKEEPKGKETKSFREQLAQHAARPTCAACHKKIDPLGFGLENYDAVGRWRDDSGGKPLDTTGLFPGGAKFNGPGELKKVLLSRKEEFLHNVVSRALTYALGRELQDEDEPAVNDVMTALAKGDNRFSALILGVVRSYPFQYRRNAEGS